MDRDKMVTQNEIFDFFKENNSNKEKSWIQNELGKFSTLKLYEDDTFLIKEYEYEYFQDQNINFYSDKSTKVEIAFFLTPHTIQDKINNVKTVYKPYHCYIYHTPKNSKVEIEFKKNLKYKNIDIYVKKDFFDDLEINMSSFKNFKKTLNNKEKSNLHLSKKGIPITPKILNYLKDIKSYKSDSELNHFYFKSKIYNIIHHLFKQYENSTDNKEQNISSYESELITEIKNYIDTHFDEKINIEFLSTNFGISRTKLKILFKKVYHKGIYEYTLEKKMDKATHFLLNANMRIKEISYALGYSSSTAFSIAFKKHTGISPSFYKEHRYNPNLEI